MKLYLKFLTMFVTISLLIFCLAKLIFPEDVGVFELLMEILGDIPFAYMCYNLCKEVQVESTFDRACQMAKKNRMVIKEENDMCYFEMSGLRGFWFDRIAFNKGNNTMVGPKYIIQKWMK